MPLDEFYVIDSHNIRFSNNPDSNYYVFYEDPARTLYAPLSAISNAAVFRERYPEIESIKARVPGHYHEAWYLALPVGTDAAVIDRVRDAWASLFDYPLLCDSDYSQRVNDVIEGLWGDDLSERVDYCRAAGVSIFAARRNAVWGTPVLYEYLRSVAVE